MTVTVRPNVCHFNLQTVDFKQVALHQFNGYGFWEEPEICNMKGMRKLRVWVKHELHVQVHHFLRCTYKHTCFNIPLWPWKLEISDLKLECIKMCLMFSEAWLISYSAGRHSLFFFFYFIFNSTWKLFLIDWWILMKNLKLGAKPSSK